MSAETPAGCPAVFAYGSLVEPRSAALTLGGEPPAATRATLSGWRRGFTQARDNRACEKTFALDADGSLPGFVLGLNVHRTGDPADRVNGVLLRLTAAELARLDEREL
ncbi:MAG: ChaC-like protein, partial [Cryptosporangiaceae bacterium]|nr:ChaC-like protein [Cryptosporangiaceae bacterium]